MFIGITILVFWVLIILLWWCRPGYTDATDTFMGTLLWVMCSLVVVPVGLHLGPGLYPGVGSIVREGYLTRANVRGIIWKTCEIEIVTGFGGDAASLSYNFSTEADGCLALEPLLGKAVQVRASEWLIIPASKGESGALITSVTPVAGR